MPGPGSLDKTPLNHIKFRGKVKRVDTSSTPAEIETAINDDLDRGWSLVNTLKDGTRILLFFQREKSRRG